MLKFGSTPRGIPPRYLRRSLVGESFFWPPSLRLVVKDNITTKVTTDEGRKKVDQSRMMMAHQNMVSGYGVYFPCRPLPMAHYQYQTNHVHDIGHRTTTTYYNSPREIYSLERCLIVDRVDSSTDRVDIVLSTRRSHRSNKVPELR